MKVFFDTSVLVPALVDQLTNHSACFEVFRAYTMQGNQGYCSTHGLAEFYAVVTALPLPKRISTVEARIIIEESILSRIEVVSLDQPEYVEAINKVANQGLTSGVVYDALHVMAAEKAGCERIYTYNPDHFRPVCPVGIQVTAP